MTIRKPVMAVLALAALGMAACEEQPNAMANPKICADFRSNAGPGVTAAADPSTPVDECARRWAYSLAGSRDSAEVVAEAKALVAMRAEQNGLDLAEVAADPSWVVIADQGRLRQVLVNLLNNAVKFTPRDGAVGVAVNALPNAKIAITVWDTGIGIPADRLERFRCQRRDRDGRGRGRRWCRAKIFNHVTETPYLP